MYVHTELEKVTKQLWIMQMGSEIKCSMKRGKMLSTLMGTNKESG